jgi:hypothetical protein
MSSATLTRARARAGATVGTAGLLLASSLVLAPAAVAATAPSCSAFNDPVYQAVNPSNGASLTTPWSGEIDKAQDDGFTDDQGVAFKASTTPGTDLVPVHRMYRSSPQDYIYTRSTTELLSAVKLFGYDDQGTTFYVSRVPADCLQPVQRYRKGTKHRLAASAAARTALVEDGWAYENVAFYAAPGTGEAAPDEPSTPVTPPPAPAPSTGDSFSFAVVPDTQNEVLVASDPRLTNRNKWLAAQRDLAFVTQTGDLVNWDTPDHRQMAMAKKSMDVLEDAGIPYSISVGNHDTEATGVGGSARDPQNTYQLQRDTSTFNSYFKASDFGAVAGAYESGKVDNVYSTYSAGGYQWMMLNLEFCARPGVVEWAKKVVAAHPDHNVLISTHSYQNGGGGIDGSNQGYGDTSGQELFDQLVSQYPNVKMVFSGHVGLAERARVDTGKNGNKIYSFLTTMHDGVTNPVRMFDVDPASGTVKTRIYAPYTNKTWDSYTQTLTGVQFVK